MTGIGYPDWQPIVTAADNPMLIGLEFNNQAPFTSTAIDVRRWSSFTMSVQYEAANVGPPANTGIVTLEWGDTAGFGNIVGRQTYEINSVNSTDCGRTIITDRHYGPFMRYSVAAGQGAASTATLVLYGSNRIVDFAQCYETANVPARGLSTDNVDLWMALVVAFGVTVSRNVRIGSGQAVLHVNFSGAGGPYNLSMYSPAIGAATPFFQRTGLAVGSESTYTFTLPRRALTIQITNTSGAANGNAFVTLTKER